MTRGLRGGLPPLVDIPSEAVSPSTPAPMTASSDVPSETTPGVEVVVVAFGAPELLETCLAALGGQFPVVVVDNSSHAGVLAVCSRHGARYIDPGRNLGFGGGVNVGLVHRQAPRADVLLLNPDAEIAAGDVSRLREYLHSHPGLACVGPRQIDGPGGSEDRVAWPFPTPLGAWMEALGLGRFRNRDDFVIGSVLLMRAEALDEIGRFDERFFLYAEETDWQRRASDLGWRVAVCTEVTAVHIGAGTGGDPAVREAHFHASHERYVRKHFGARGWQVYRAAVMTGAALRALILPGQRGRAAADRLHLYRVGPCRSEARL